MQNTSENVNVNLDDFIIDDSFSYEGYQVVRGEFFAHLCEPSITFNMNKVAFNSACVNKIPEIEYVQFLINSETKMLVARPSTEDEKDSHLWSTVNPKTGKRRSKQITCGIFFAKVISLMDWNPDYRYKILGKLIKSNEEYLFVFDLNNTEVYQRIHVEGSNKLKGSRKPVFPEAWKNQFGLSVEEHKKSLQVSTFDGYAVFSVTSEEASTNGGDKVE